MVTKQITPKEVVRTWHLIDAKGKVLGQVCTQAAQLLMGKQKVSFTPHVDSGDYVVVVNAKEVVVTGNKAKTKKYYSHSGIPGGFKEITFEKLMAKDPRKIISHGIHGMLPKNKLRDPRMTRLKIFVDEKHPYEQLVTN